MISPNELAQLRRDVAALLPDTCVIEAATSSTSDEGYVGETWTTVGTFACRLDPANRQSLTDMMIAQREAGTVYYVLTLPYDAPAAMGNRVVKNGLKYEILQVHGDHSLRASKRLIVALIQGA